MARIGMRMLTLSATSLRYCHEERILPELRIDHGSVLEWRNQPPTPLQRQWALRPYRVGFYGNDDSSSD